MGCGELFQKLLASLDLVADGTILADAVVICFRNNKENGEKQGKYQQHRPAAAAKRVLFAMFLSSLLLNE